MNTVLIIDDNPQDVRLLGAALSNSNFHVIFSLNGMDGFKNACATLPDLILLDRMMPEMDGFKVCRLLKSDERTVHIPTIFLTAMETIEDKVEGFKLGACDYITKPCHPDELTMRIRTHIDLHHRLNHSKNHEPTNGKNLPSRLLSVENLSRAEMRVQKAQAFYLQDLTINLSLSVVAKQIGTHARQLSDDFKLVTGKHIQNWLQEKRMEKACHLLLETDIEINRVAEDVGYTSVATFSNTFRDYFGMPPKEYRRLLGLSDEI